MRFLDIKKKSNSSKNLGKYIDFLYLCITKSVRIDRKTIRGK